jgi:hypothetical protein
VFGALSACARAEQEHRICRSVIDMTLPPWARGPAEGRDVRLSNMNEELHMRLFGKTTILLGMAGAMALGSMTASEARWRAGPAAAAGFVAGAAVGAAAANANAGYYYGSGYDSYAYEPAYAAPVYTPPSYYGPVNTYGSSYYSGYDTNYIGPWHERRLQGHDY